MLAPAQSERRCCICEQTLPLDRFSRDKTKALGYGYRCRECDRARMLGKQRPDRSHLTCKACGEPIILKKHHKYCSTECREAHHRLRPPRTCEICAVEYVPSYADQRTCGRSCGVELKRRLGTMPDGRLGIAYGSTCELTYASCLLCHQPFLARRSQKTCPHGCAARLKYQRSYNYLPPVDCEACGATITERRGSGRYCSKRCARQSPSYKASRRRRRARKRGAVTEPYLSSEIYERDGWRCQLCGKTLARGAVVPHPHAPTIDHIIPLSLGGSDLRANVQAAHFLCNAKKGASSANEQLLLIG